MTIANSSTTSSSSAKTDKNVNRTEEPSAPSPGLVLFNTEDQSDIVFNVGIDQDVATGQGGWRFPAHSFIVVEASPVFATIIKTQLDHHEEMMTGNKPEIYIHCQPEIFHIMLR